MKKVLLINPILYTAENDTRKLTSIQDTLFVTVCKGFLEIGYEPVLLADEYYRPVNEEYFGFEIIYFKHRLRKIFKPSKMPLPIGLISYLRKNHQNFDFIITSEAFSWYSLIASIMCPDKTIIWQELAIHNKMLNGYASKVWYGIMVRLFMKKIVIAPRSEKAKQFIKLYCNRVDKDIYQHPIDIDKFKVKETKEKYFISISQLVPRKNVNKIIHCFSDFFLNNSDYSLLICGDGEKKEELMKMAEESVACNKIRFLGQIGHSELGKLLAGSQGLLIYTDKDNSILTISESIACATPILTTTVPDNSVYVSHNKCGIVKNDWDDRDMSELVRNNEFYIRNCLDVRKKLTAKYLANEFDKLFKRIK